MLEDGRQVVPELAAADRAFEIRPQHKSGDGRAGATERHALIPREPCEVVEHSGDQFLPAGILRNQGSSEKI